MCWRNLVVAGFGPGHIITLDAVTGVHISILSGHTDCVGSIVFSSDGTFLVSGSYDRTVKLWDFQTGGVVKTFYGHNNEVFSVSISVDHTVVASGSSDHTIHLWNTQTGECYHIIDKYNSLVTSVSFSPTIPQLLISASRNNSVQQWDINGHEVGPTHDGDYIALSMDGTYTVSWRWGENTATVQDSDSGAITAEITHSGSISYSTCWCISPNSNYMACGVNSTIYVWVITSLGSFLTKPFIGHTNDITSLTLSSSLLISSNNGSIKFWQIDTLPADPVAVDLEST